MPTPVQQYIGRFTLEHLRGATSFASLYQAVDTRTGREVALKVFNQNFPADALEKSGLIAMNQRLAAITHPHILSVLDSDTRDGGWIATDFLRARSLKERLDRLWEPSAVGEVISQVASALDAAHKLGIVHADLKPANVLVDASGLYRLADFGMAAMAAQAPPIVRLYGSTPLPPYMSPEQASQMSLSPRSDVYSLGVLAYHLLAGSVPYTGTDAITVAGKQARGLPEDLRESDPSIPESVNACVLMALSRNPDGRYSSASAFAQAFHDALVQAAAEGPRALPAQPREVEAARGLAPPRADAPRLCWACGALTPPGSDRCQACWRPLDQRTGTELSPIRQVSRLAEFARSSLMFSLALVTGVAVMAMWPKPAFPATSSDLSSPVGAGVWTSFQADTKNTGFAPGPAPALRGEVRWQLPMDAGVLAAPIVTKDTVYLATGDARVMALDPATGAVRWERKVLGPVNAIPAVAGDLLYVGLRNGNLLALDAKTGQERWALATGGSVYGGMKVKGGAVYLGNGNGTILAADAATGDLLWRFESPGWISAIPAITDNGLVVIGSEEGSIYVLDAATGKLKLKNRVFYAVGSSAAVIGDVAYFGRDQGALLAVDLQQTSRVWDDFVYWSKLQFFIFGLTDYLPERRGSLWRAVPGIGAASSPAVAGRTAYFVTELGSGRKAGGALHAVDLDTHKQKWSFPVKGSQTPTIIDDTVYVSSVDGKLVAVAADTGKLRWEWRIPGGMRPTTPPIVAGDKVYVGAASHDPLLYVDRRDARGELLSDQAAEAADNWYFRFGASYCGAQETNLHGPFSTQQDSLNAGYSNTPSCGMLFAVG